MYYRIKSSKYGDALKREEYNGQWSIAAIREKDGKEYKQWVHPSTKNGPHEKVIPLAVGRMTRQEMMDMLKLFIQALQTDEHGTINTTPSVNDSETPF